MQYQHSRAYEGYFGQPPVKKMQKFIMENDRVVEIHDVKVHKFLLGDVDDADLYAAVPIMEWQNSEQGQWVMKHAVESPMWHRYMEPVTYGWQYMITAKLRGPDYTFFTMKWGHLI
jgi:hypothetical protein